MSQALSNVKALSPELKRVNRRTGKRETLDKADAKNTSPLRDLKVQIPKTASVSEASEKSNLSNLFKKDSLDKKKKESDSSLESEL